jgi:hypothetical protein
MKRKRYFSLKFFYNFAGCLLLILPLFTPTIAYSTNTPKQPFSEGGTVIGYFQIGEMYGSAYQNLYRKFAEQCEAFYNDTKTTIKPIQDNYLLAEIAIDITMYDNNIVEKLGTIFDFFSYDNPKYYFIYNVAYWTRENIITSCALKIEPEYASALSRKINKYKIDRKFSEYKSLVNGRKLSNYDIARVVKDKILAERDYAIINEDNDLNPYAHNILGVMDLSTNGPVCESFSKAYMYILNRLGVENYFVFGSFNFRLGYNSEQDIVTEYREASEKHIPLSAFSSDTSLTIEQKILSICSGIGAHTWNMIRMEDGLYYLADITDFEITSKKAGLSEKPDIHNLSNEEQYSDFLVKGEDNKHFSYFNLDNERVDYGYKPPSQISKKDYKQKSNYLFITNDVFQDRSNTKLSSYTGKNALGDYFGDLETLEYLKVQSASVDPNRLAYTSYFSTLKKGRDYEIETQKVQGTKYYRVYVIGIGDYLGVDMGYATTKEVEEMEPTALRVMKALFIGLSTFQEAVQ